MHAHISPTPAVPAFDAAMAGIDERRRKALLPPEPPPAETPWPTPADFLDVARRAEHRGRALDLVGEIRAGRSRVAALEAGLAMVPERLELLAQEELDDDEDRTTVMTTLAVSERLTEARLVVVRRRLGELEAALANEVRAATSVEAEAIEAANKVVRERSVRIRAHAALDGLDYQALQLVRFGEVLEKGPPPEQIYQSQETWRTFPRLRDEVRRLLDAPAEAAS